MFNKIKHYLGNVLKNPKTLRQQQKNAMQQILIKEKFFIKFKLMNDNEYVIEDLSKEKDTMNEEMSLEQICNHDRSHLEAIVFKLCLSLDPNENEPQYV